MSFKWVSRSLRLCLRNQFSRPVSPAPSFNEDQYEIIRGLEDSFSLLLDSQDQFTSFQIKTLLECSETANEVRILTAPREFLVASESVFEEVRNLLCGKEVVFTLDPSYCLRIDRKLFHLEQIANVKSQGGVEQGQSFAEELQNMSATELDQGFYRNIFGLHFPEECLVEVEAIRKVIQESLKEHTGTEFSSEEERSQYMFKKAQRVIWDSLVSPKDFFFVNPNIKMLFEFALLQGFDNESIFLTGMPELLFRAKFAHQITPASIISDLHSMSGLIENQEWVGGDKQSQGPQGDHKMDLNFMIKSCLHFNTLHFKTRYTLLLLRELALTYENLVVVTDPLTTSYLRELLEEEKQTRLDQSLAKEKEQEHV